MKTVFRFFGLMAAVIIAQPLISQVPAGAPAGTTGLCKDGTYSSAASKSGACGGHKGVQTWYAAAAPKPAAAAAAAKPATPAVAAKPATPAAPAVAPAKAAAPPTPAATTAAAAPKAAGPAAKAAAMQQAPGGGPGLVWLNTTSNVYHCSGSAYYGKTKAGAYMTEAAAKAKGARANDNKACAAK